MSLLQRLAQVGLGRREEPEESFEPHEIEAPARRNEADYRAAPERRAQEQVSEYARRPAGRPAVTESGARSGRSRIEDDELEIPAFLRRHAN